MAYRVFFVSQLTVNEKFIASFDNKYVYTQLNSPKKTICTIVILDNFGTNKKFSYTLPYFNDRTIRKIMWGINSNDLFILSADTGLTVYRKINETWAAFFIRIENDENGSSRYYLFENDIKYLEISSDTIPTYVKNYLVQIYERFM